jgi:hypothetical protein
MTPQDYRAALARLGWSISGAGPKLGVLPRQSQRWASLSNPYPIPKSKQMLLDAKLKETSDA